VIGDATRRADRIDVRTRPLLTVAAAIAALAVPLAAVGDPAPGSLTMGPQAMEGNLVLAPGATLSAGYDLSIPGSHPAVSVTVSGAQVVFAGRCTAGGAAVAITVPMGDQTYAVPASNGSWFPSGDQHSPLVYQGAIAVPDACGGGTISLGAGGTFTAQLFSDVPVPGNGVHVRWHYSANGSSGSWSATAAVQPAPGGATL
jgi:hypothetical protein